MKKIVKKAAVKAKTKTAAKNVAKGLPPVDKTASSRPEVIKTKG